MIGRLLLLALAACFLAGCSPREVTRTHGVSVTREDAGWHYSSNGRLPRIAYGFDEPTMMIFAGHCDARPIYALIGGSYSTKAGSASLIIDGKTRRFDISRGEHGGGLLFLANLELVRHPLLDAGREELSIARDLANARHPIIISTDDGWTRQIPTNANLGRFARECIAFRRTETRPLG